MVKIMVKRAKEIRVKKNKKEKEKKDKGKRERKNQMVDQVNPQEINQLNNKPVKVLFLMQVVQEQEYLYIHGLADCSTSQILKLKLLNMYYIEKMLGTIN